MNWFQKWPTASKALRYMGDLTGFHLPVRKRNLWIECVGWPATGREKEHQGDAHPVIPPSPPHKGTH